MTFYSVSAVIGYAAGYKRLKKYNNNNNNKKEVGSRKWEVGSRKWEVGNGKWEGPTGLSYKTVLFNENLKNRLVNTTTYLIRHSNLSQMTLYFNMLCCAQYLK